MGQCKKSGDFFTKFILRTNSHFPILTLTVHYYTISLRSSFCIPKTNIQIRGHITMAKPAIDFCFGRNDVPGELTSDSGIKKAVDVYSSLRRTRPKSKRDIKNYVRVFLGLDVPDKSICPDHNSPMDYLWHIFAADFAAERQVNGDAIVWANRSGGKTELAAIGTLLDCVFRAI